MGGVRTRSQDRQTVWQRTAYEGVPREKRHIKATYANATPVTDGRYVVAFFGLQGLYAFEMDGTPAWKKDLGVLNTGVYDLPEYEWGTASSPIIYKDMVIVQCDTQNESFVLAADIRTGRTVWKTVRQELPAWGTPTVYVPLVAAAPSSSRTPRTSCAGTIPTRAKTLAPRTQLEDHRADARLRRRTDYRRERTRPRAAHLRDSARRPRRHHSTG